MKFDELLFAENRLLAVLGGRLKLSRRYVLTAVLLKDQVFWDAALLLNG